MNNRRVIIVTENVKEAIDLHNHVGDIFFVWSIKRPTNQYPTDGSFYDKTWYWYFDDNGNLTGQSGYGAFDTALRNTQEGTGTYKCAAWMKRNEKLPMVDVQFNNIPPGAYELCKLNKTYKVQDIIGYEVQLELEDGAIHPIDLGWLKKAPRQIEASTK